MKDVTNIHYTFHAKPCGRCGGSGKYSFNLMYGTMCFGCEGQRKVPTTASRHARKAIATHRAAISFDGVSEADRVAKLTTLAKKVKRIRTGVDITVTYIDGSTELINAPSPEALAKREAAAVKREAAKIKKAENRIAKREALATKKRDEFIAAHPEITDYLTALESEVHKNNDFVRDVLNKLDRYGSLSDAQLAAIPGSLARDEFIAARTAKREEEKANAGPAPIGRHEVTGTIVHTKWQDSDWGTTKKILVVLTNGSRVWSSVPSNASGNTGDVLTFRATFTVKDDPHFAFASRPHLISEVVI